MCGHKLR